MKSNYYDRRGSFSKRNVYNANPVRSSHRAQRDVRCHPFENIVYLSTDSRNSDRHGQTFSHDYIAFPRRLRCGNSPDCSPDVDVKYTKAAVMVFAPRGHYLLAAFSSRKATPSSSSRERSLWTEILIPASDISCQSDASGIAT